MVDGEFSDVASVEIRSPQGSVLSPVLFVCFVNDVCEQIINCKFHLYADDLQLYIVDLGGDVDTLVRLANEDLVWRPESKFVSNTSTRTSQWILFPFFRTF
jgi:hypothetical protein